MSFSADAFRAGEKKWAFTANGRTYIAHPVSAMQVSEFLERRRADASDRGFFRAVEWLLRLMFPKRISYWWRGDPVAQFLALPRAGLEEALSDFFSYNGVKMRRAS